MEWVAENKALLCELLFFVVGYILARATGVSPRWKSIGRWMIGQLNAEGQVTKADVRTSGMGGDPTLNAELDRIEPQYELDKLVKRVPVVERVLTTIRDKAPLVQGIAGLVGMLRKRKR
jgi:hypothetical protein